MSFENTNFRLIFFCVLRSGVFPPQGAYVFLEVFSHFQSHFLHTVDEKYLSAAALLFCNIFPKLEC